MDVPRVVKCLGDRCVPTRNMTLEPIEFELAKGFLSKTVVHFGLLVIASPPIRVAFSASYYVFNALRIRMLTCRRRLFDPFRKTLPEQGRIQGRLRNSLTQIPNSQNSR